MGCVPDLFISQVCFMGNLLRVGARGFSRIQEDTPEGRIEGGSLQDLRLYIPDGNKFRVAGLFKALAVLSISLGAHSGRYRCLKRGQHMLSLFQHRI